MPALPVLAIALCTLTSASAGAQPQPADAPAPPPAAAQPAPAKDFDQPVPAPAEQPPDVPFTTDPRVEYVLDAEGNWVATSAPAAGSDAAVMADARRLIADGEPGKAKSALDQWINANSRGRSPYLPQAYLLRGDATTANGDEFAALYDYEALIRQFPASPEFVKAIERELEIATAYVRGMNRKWLGIRWVDGTETGVELLIRVQERLPGSRLAEQAGIELADFYYRTRELSLASEAYDLFLKNYPNSKYRSRALQRQVYANIGRYKGPAYDGSSLLDSRVLIRRYMSMYPASAEEAGLDEALLARIDESAAAQMLETARWYLIREDPVSARSMLRRLLKKHPQSAAAGVALKTMEEKGWITLDRSVPGALGAPPPAGSVGAAEAPPVFEPAPPEQQPAPESAPTNGGGR